MRWPRGKPVIRQGTLPTPEDPTPSNQIIEEYPDGHAVIKTGNPDEKILREYREALAQHPDHSGLHLYYGMSLGYSGQTDEAIRELRVAASLAPAEPSSHMFLGTKLTELGRYEEAIPELNEALRLLQSNVTEARRQGEAIARWSLSTALEKSGRHEEAVGQLQQAVEVQRRALDEGRGSDQLLGQLEEALAALG